MLKILIITPDGNSASDFYRCLPLRYISGLDVDMVRLGITDKGVAWSVLSAYDIIYFSRPYLRSHLMAVYDALTLQKKVWVDYDDLLTDVPIYNGAYSYYVKAKDIIEKIVSVASVITATNIDLLNNICQCHGNSYVVENAFNEHVMKFHGFSDREQIVWRGSPTHIMDLYNEREALSQFPIHYIGYRPPFISDKDEYTVFNSSLMEYIHSLSCRLGQTYIFPLDDTLFNRCKSFIGWYEATSAGAATVGRWQLPSVIDYTKEGLLQTMKCVAKDKDLRYMKYNQSVEDIQQNYMLSTINKIRAEILNNYIWG